MPTISWWKILLDSVSSRDVIFHVSEKSTLLNNFYTWLKDDGRLLITDFCCGSTPFSQDLIDYARSGMYNLTSIQEYTEVSGLQEVHNTTRERLFLLATGDMRFCRCPRRRLLWFVSKVLSRRNRNRRKESIGLSFGRFSLPTMRRSRLTSLV